MAPRQTLNQEQRRLLKIAARMPLASVANLAPVLDLEEDKVRRILGALCRGGWVTSVVRGMTERRQHRWFLTRRAVDLLYVTDHQHPAPREEARAAGRAAFHPEGGQTVNKWVRSVGHIASRRPSRTYSMIHSAAHDSHTHARYLMRQNRLLATRQLYQRA